MTSSPAFILAINGGSSSVKFSFYQIGVTLSRVLSGAVDRIGSNAATLSWRTADRESEEARTAFPRNADTTSALVDWLEERPEFQAVTAIGHRVVHGLSRTEPARLTPTVVDELHRAIPFAPDHLPGEIALIETFRDRHPHLPQVACFDTSFHRAMPPVARLLPLPRRYHAMGVQRYGFHGLSYAYLMEELARMASPDAARGRVILAHLGNGASLAAVHGGKSLDTSMGFTPAAGLVMSTRTGDLDPGVAWFLAHSEQMTARQFHYLVNHQSGLLGVSETSSDMRDLLAREANDPRATEAVELFCYQAKKWVGAFTAALGGLDTLVFSAGIGAGSAPIRARICEGLGCFGIELHEARNAAHAAVISTDTSHVTVRVIHTDEEQMIARSVARLLGSDGRATGEAV